MGVEPNRGLGTEEDVPIEHKWVTKTIENCIPKLVRRARGLRGLGSPQTLALYLADRADQGRKVSALAQALAASIRVRQPRR